MNNIKKILVNSNSPFICSSEETIEKIIKKLNEIDENFILIINKKKEFIGTVTDGDLRRSMLNDKITIKDKIIRCMNKKPYFGKIKENKKNLEILELINLHNPFLPIVDKNKLLIEVLISNKEVEKISTALVLAGGRGSRLGKLTKNTPKPLLKIGKQTILEKILDQLIQEGFKNIFLSVCYLQSKFEKFIKNYDTHINISLLKEPYPLGTAGSLSMLPREIDENILAMNADILTNINLQDLINMHIKNKNNITIAAALNKIKVDYGVIEYEKNFKFKRINEKPTIEHFVNAGLYCLSKSVINLVNKNENLDMPQLFQLSKSSGQKIGVFPMHENWIDLGTPQEFKNAFKKK